ncbi:MAG: GMC family oxidoreductase N-terminal domain-containing protein [Pseudomonadota bacterium]|nr:GMC family oxidoreductase N-terminal domain-containing protein [Pseudomonadota bacterium]
MEFDYVVVGAGSSGCVVANRLSQCGRYSVALIEAGPSDNNPWIHVPVGYFKTMGNPKSDWCYKTQPDPGIAGRSIPWPRGRVLGGSSSINGLLYVRGQPQDFDTWSQLGCTGWSWDDVLPYFKRSEKWDGVDDSGLRGKDGLLSVQSSRLNRDIVDNWVDAAVTAGYQRNYDYNGFDQEGVGYFQLTMKGGRRCSAAAAYLTPVKSRKNLQIITNAQTKKVNIVNGRASSVEIDTKNNIDTISAKKEIILSAGSIGSPQILMLSGIGSGEELQNLGINVIRDLDGVGKNLQDHLQARPIFKTDLSTINTETGNYAKKALIGLQYILTQRGPLTMAASLGTGFLKTEDHLETPDIQFHIQPFSADMPSKGPHKFSAFTASVLQLRPESKGYLTLKSPNYLDHPNIHPNYLATATDCNTIVKGVQIARKIAEHEPLKKHILEEYAPGSDVPLNDEEGTLDWVRRTAVTIYHPSGTCKMGTDEMSVVTPTLKVRGLEGLRVADASIMPSITSGNTNAPAIMIGEKASDLILEEA